MPSRRVLVGVGRVKSVGSRNEYLYAGSPDGKQRSLIWERMVSHSIRPRMPYHEALAKCADGNAFNPAEVVSITPEGRFTEFSYATEHVSDDAAIEALQSIRSALLKSAELFGADIKQQEDWVDRELGRLWTKRGPFPGMGAVLSASGVPMGNFIAREVSEQAGDNKSPWDAWFSSLSDPAANFPPELAGHIDPTIAKSWERMPAERREFTELLSRVDLTTDQANTLVTPEMRKSIGAEVDDNGFLANPYLLYEATRLTSIPVPIGLVDRGVFRPMIGGSTGLTCAHRASGSRRIPVPFQIGQIPSPRAIENLDACGRAPPAGFDDSRPRRGGCDGAYAAPARGHRSRPPQRR